MFVGIYWMCCHFINLAEILLISSYFFFWGSFFEVLSIQKILWAIRPTLHLPLSRILAGRPSDASIVHVTLQRCMGNTLANTLATFAGLMAVLI
jgi:hypothetical protein